MCLWRFAAAPPETSDSSEVSDVAPRTNEFEVVNHANAPAASDPTADAGPGIAGGGVAVDTPGTTWPNTCTRAVSATEDRVPLLAKRLVPVDMMLLGLWAIATKRGMDTLGGHW